MKNKSYLSKTLITLISLCFLLISCNKDDYYATPSWLKGSIYQVLEQHGDYSIFLKGVELAKMKPMLDGKSILTVMAPNDSAFTVYLNEYYGGKKIEDLPVNEISKLIGFHVLYYSFDKNKLINFRPADGDGASVADKNINAGLYYKFRTKSMDSISIEKDTAGNDVSVYHLERFLPVFSYRMFQTKQIDAKTNYEYFFPNTQWKHANGFNVSNAAVNEFAIIASNGYIHTVDHVLRPLETIYKELASNTEYSDFLDLYNAYDYYLLDANLTLEYGNGTNLYQHYHSAPLPNIACEWPVTDYRLVDQLALKSYSVFAPNNTAFRSFFDDYWRVGGYNSLSEVSKTSIEYLLFNCVYSSSIVFPEEIKKGLIINSYGTKINFNVDNVPAANRKICVNGALYGLNELTPPSMFGSVTGPAFQYKKFTNFLTMLKSSDLVLTLSSDQTKYLMLYPSNDLMSKVGVTAGVNGSLYNGTQLMSATAQQNYVFAHVVSLDGTTGSYQSLPTSGTHVLRTLSPTMKLYWYMKDGKITNSVKHNQLLYVPGIVESDVYSDLTELNFRDGWTNGKCYSYENTTKPFMFEGSQANAIYGSFIPMMFSNRNQASTLYYGFIQLLDKAQLTESTSQSIIPVVESSLMFVPTTTAIKQGILAGKVPGIKTSSTDISDVNFFTNCTVTDLAALKYYMLQYFIPLSTAIISNYPYVGWQETITTGLPTLQTYDVPLGGGKVETKITRMKVTDANNKVSIETVDSNGNPSGNWVDVIEDYHYFPFVFDDGCVQFIKEVL
jgi:hypothetical protein